MPFASWEWGCRWTISEPVIRASAGLAHLPIRELKIDRSFMRDVESDASRAGDRYHRGSRRPELAAHRRRRRRRNPRGSEICWRNSDATLFRDFSTPRRCHPPRSGVGCLTIVPAGRARCSGASVDPCRSRRPGLRASPLPSGWVSGGVIFRGARGQLPRVAARIPAEINRALPAETVDEKSHHDHWPAWHH